MTSPNTAPWRLIWVVLLTSAASGVSSETQMQIEENSGFANSNGLQIYFQCIGTGTPIVLVHGWGSNSKNNWLDTGWVDALKEHRQVITIDVRGHGNSDKPHALAPYGYNAMSADVLAVMDTLDITRADFIGYSMGSFMGVYLLGHHPERFSSMVLGGIGNETEASAAQGLNIAQALRTPDPANISTEVGKRVRTFIDSNPNNDLEALAYSAQKMWPEGYPLKVAGPNLAKANLPVLIVNGQNDKPYVDSADSLAAALPNAKHIRISDTNHLTTVTDPRFKQIVVEFLTAH